MTTTQQASILQTRADASTAKSKKDVAAASEIVDALNAVFGRYGRYRIVPMAGEHFVPRDQLERLDADSLREESRQRIARGLVPFQLLLQLSATEDRLDDPSVAWPEVRDTVVLGRIDITKVDADSEAAERSLLFSPAALPTGIEAADPMIQVPQDAYGVSFERRHGWPLHRVGS